MAILTAQNNEHTLSTAHLIESGTGNFVLDSKITGSTPQTLTVEQLDLPFAIAAGASVTVLGGFVAVIGGTTPSAIATPTKQSEAGDTITEVGGTETLQFGSGAAILENGVDEVYVRLNQISYPLEFNGAGSDTPTLKVVGENSVIGH